MTSAADPTTTVRRFDIDAALARLVDHIQGMDADELACLLSTRCIDGIVIVTEGDDEESSPYRDGQRMRVTYTPDHINLG
jgi:hypothetical protein